MRNREIGLYLIVAGVITVLGTWTGCLVEPTVGLLCCTLSLALSGWGFAFTLWRYRKIKELTQTLEVAATGAQVPDIRSNREGELSILQNDLYKLITQLAGQADHLRTDKIFLADALSDISHQLNTPLTGMMVHVDLLQSESLPPEKRRAFLNLLSGQLERLRWLVAALLRLSRLDAGVIFFKRETVALHRLLSDAVAPLLPQAEAKDVALSIECPRGLCWSGDAEWTREAVMNLAKNAIEHAPSGGLVQLRCADNPLHILLTVEDDGAGFSATDLSRLFERFYRGANEPSEGVGIGLAMAKAILQAQGAGLSAENRSEGGARFVVKLYNTDGIRGGTATIK